MNDHIGKIEAIKSSRPLLITRWIGLVLAATFMMFANYSLAATSTQLVDTINFDHVKTGFKLTGAHTSVRCAQCHINNVLKGTPRDCATCHMIGNPMGASAKPSSHMNTNVQCDNCHRTLQWSPAFFTHVGLADGSCTTCHNGDKAKGKPNNHMLTNAECSDCHVTVSFVTLKASANIPLPSGHFPTTQICGACHVGASFLPGRMNHIGITGGCDTCHKGTTTFLGGITPRGKPSGHMQTNSSCEACHTSTSTFLVANLTIAPVGHIPSTQPCSTCHTSGFGQNSGIMRHTGIVSGCANCHNGQSFPVGPVLTVSKPTSSPVHIPTSMPCEICHSPNSTSSGGFSGDPKSIMKHTGIVSGCGSCHNDGLSFAGVTPMRKQDALATHMTTSQDCSVCHTSTTTFKGASGGVLPAGHLPTSQPCSTCHISGYGPNSGFLSGTSGMNHVGIVTGCLSCHNGQTFTVAGAMSVTPRNKSNSPTTHITTSEDCYKCHTSTTTFTGASPTVMPAGHLPTTKTCSTCHTSYGPNSGTMGAAGHAGIVNNCVQCHNGQTFAVGMKPVSKANFPPHVATSLDCSSCHSTTNFTTFAGATGGAMPSNHLPTTQACTLCHSAGYSISLSKMNHLGIVSGCASCHNGQTFAVGMRPVSKGTSPPHIPTSMPCETCHSSSVFTTFGGTMMKHTGIVSGCANCHSGTAYQGVTPTRKPTNHVPTSATRPTGGDRCETCHSISNFNTFSGTSMKHTGIVNNCVECHGTVGSPKPYIGPPRYEPTNHIPYAANLLGGATMQCEFCHKSTSAFTLGVSSTAMHNGTQGKPVSGACTGCHLSGTSYLGVQGRKSLSHESPGKPDCSTSGCHRPLGTRGSSYNSW